MFSYFILYSLFLLFSYILYYFYLLVFFNIYKKIQVLHSKLHWCYIKHLLFSHYSFLTYAKRFRSYVQNYIGITLNISYYNLSLVLYYISKKIHKHVGITFTSTTQQVLHLKHRALISLHSADSGSIGSPPRRLLSLVSSAKYFLLVSRVLLMRMNLCRRCRQPPLRHTARLAQR